MAVRPVAVVAVLVLVALGGCVDPRAPTPQRSEQYADAVYPAPEWTDGETWTWNVSYVSRVQRVGEDPVESKTTGNATMELVRQVPVQGSMLWLARMANPGYLPFAFPWGAHEAQPFVLIDPSDGAFYRTTLKTKPVCGPEPSADTCHWRVDWQNFTATQRTEPAFPVPLQSGMVWDAPPGTYHLLLDTRLKALGDPLPTKEGLLRVAGEISPDAQDRLEARISAWNAESTQGSAPRAQTLEAQAEGMFWFDLSAETGNVVQGGGQWHTTYNRTQYQGSDPFHSGCICGHEWSFHLIAHEIASPPTERALIDQDPLSAYGRYSYLQGLKGPQAPVVTWNGSVAAVPVAGDFILRLPHSYPDETENWNWTLLMDGSITDEGEGTVAPYAGASPGHVEARFEDRRYEALAPSERPAPWTGEIWVDAEGQGTISCLGASPCTRATVAGSPAVRNATIEIELQSEAPVEVSFHLRRGDATVDVQSLVAPQRFERTYSDLPPMAGDWELFLEAALPVPVDAGWTLTQDAAPR